MKIYRIICGSLLLLGGLGAFYLTVRALGTQTSWSAKARAAEAAVEEAELGLPQLKASILGLQTQLDTANAGFGRVFDAPNPGFDAQGRVSLPLGTSDGLSAGENGAPSTLVHLFAPTGGADGETRYIGPFAVAQAGERQSTLTPAFEVQPGEAQGWPPGVWRARLDVPVSRDARFTELDAGLVKRRELLRNRRNTLEVRRQSVAEAQDTLAARERELLGDPDAPEISDAPEVRAGLVATLDAEEAERAADLAELDRLRRAVKNAADRLRTLLAENRGLAEELPTAAPPRTARGQ